MKEHRLPEISFGIYLSAGPTQGPVQSKSPAKAIDLILPSNIPTVSNTRPILPLPRSLHR